MTPLPGPGSLAHRALSRRDLLIRTGSTLGAAALGGSLLAACGGDDTGGATATAIAPADLGSEPITLKVWSWDESVLDFLKGRARQWNADPDRPQLTLDAVTVNAENATTKLIGTLTANSGAPDIAHIQEAEIPRLFANDLAESALVSLNDYIAPIRDEFSEAKWILYSNQGNAYGIEVTMAPSVLYYRPDSFAKAGIESVPETTEEWLAAQQTARGKDVYLSAVTFGTDYLTGSWKGAFMQAGGNIFDADGACVLDQGDAAAYATDTYARLIQDDLAIRLVGSNTDAVLASAYKSGQLIATTGPDWWVAYQLEPAVPDQAGSWQVALLPATPNGVRSGTFGGGGLTITKQADRPEAAYAFLEFAALTLEGQLEKWREIGYFPTMKEAWKDPAVTDFTMEFFGDQKKVGQFYADSAAELPVFYTSPVRAEAETVIQRELVHPVATRERTTDEGIRIATEEIQKLVERQA